MRRFCFVSVLILFLAALAASLPAETLELTDGTTVTGELVLPANADGINIRLPSGQYQRVAWDKFSQSALLELARNPRLVPYVEPFIEQPEEDRIKRTEIEIKPVERLERPEDASLIGSLFRSSVGLFGLLLIYAAGIYAAYEISIVRAYPPLMVCGVCAVLPVIGHIIFVCMPTRMDAVKVKEDSDAAVQAATQAQVQAHIAAASGPAQPQQPAGLRLSTEGQGYGAQEIPETQVFQRGKFTFNRRFFETKFSGFFGVVRREKEKDLLMIVKTPRGEFTATRVSRISTNEMHLDVHKGGASQEVLVPFGEIQEVQLKHKDAP
jgi:hypothetical protein